MKPKDVIIGKKVIMRTWAGSSGREVTIAEMPQKICGLWSCWVEEFNESVPLCYLSEN